MKRKEVLDWICYESGLAPASMAANNIADRFISQMRDMLERISYKIGDEEEPAYSPGGATYGDTEHDHNAVVYGRNEAKGEAQGIIETELATLHQKDKPRKESRNDA